MASEDLQPASAAAATESLRVQLGGREHSIEYRAGDTVLGAVRRAGLKGPFNCQQGNCGTCIARLEKGTAAMRAKVRVMSPAAISSTTANAV